MITSEQLAQILARNGYRLEGDGAALRARKYSELQKQEADYSRPKREPAAPRYKARSKKADGGNHPRYSLTVNFRVSDKRKRDLDGLLSTVLDCLVTARGRFAAMDSTDPH